jgi:hypothetical protein
MEKKVPGDVEFVALSAVLSLIGLLALEVGDGHRQRVSSHSMGVVVFVVAATPCLVPYVTPFTVLVTTLWTGRGRRNVTDFRTRPFVPSFDPTRALDEDDIVHVFQKKVSKSNRQKFCAKSASHILAYQGCISLVLVGNLG